MFKNSLVVLIIVLFMAGCASKKPHIEPRNPLATILTIPVQSDKWDHGMLRLSKKNSRGCGDFEKNVLPNSFDKDFSMGLDGGEDVIFHIVRSDTEKSCENIGIFYAGKGNDYILNLESKEDACIVSLIEKKQNGMQRKINTYPAHISRVDGVKVCANKDRLY